MSRTRVFQSSRNDLYVAIPVEAVPAPYCGDVACAQVQGFEPLGASPGVLPPLTVNDPYTHTVVITGGVPPYTFSIDPEGDPLPTGLTLNPATGEISGTPTVVGQNGSVRVIVVDDVGNTITIIIPMLVLP